MMNIQAPNIKNIFITSSLPVLIAVSAHIEHKETHIPCNVQVIKNWVRFGLIDLNLLSSPSLDILRNRNELNLIAQIIINIAIIKFAILITESEVTAKLKMTTVI